MSDFGNFNDMIGDDLNVDVNNMFEANNAEDKGGDGKIEQPSDNDNNTKSENDLSVNEFFDENIDDTIDDNNEVDSPDSDNNSDDKSSSNSAPSNFTAILAKDLMDQGIISSLSDEDFAALVEEKGEADALRSLIQGEVTNASNALKADYDESYQEYLTMVQGGVDKNVATDLVSTRDAFNAITEDQIDNEDNESLRRDLMMEHYKLTTKFSDSKINKLVDRSFDLGEDVEEAKDALTNIKSIIDDKIKDETTAAKQAEQQRLQQLEDSRNQLKQSIDSISEILPGQKINKQTKDKMFDLITKPVQDKDGNTTNALWAKRSEDPIEFDQKLAYLLQTGFFEKGKAWDKVKTVKTTNEASQLDEFLSNNKSRTGHMRIKDNNRDTKDVIKSTASILGR